MSALEDFLNLGDVKDINEEIKVVVGGKELALKVRALTEIEHSDFQKRAQSIGRKSVSFDVEKYNSLILTTCIIEPNFNSAEFLEKAKCTTAWEFLTRKFPAGVLSDVASKIQEISGFKPFEMEIEEAKN